MNIIAFALNWGNNSVQSWGENKVLNAAVIIRCNVPNASREKHVKKKQKQVNSSCCKYLQKKKSGN